MCGSFLFFYLALCLCLQLYSNHDSRQSYASIRIIIPGIIFISPFCVVSVFFFFSLRYAVYQREYTSSWFRFVFYLPSFVSFSLVSVFNFQYCYCFIFCDCCFCMPVEKGVSETEDAKSVSKIVSRMFVANNNNKNLRSAWLQWPNNDVGPEDTPERREKNDTVNNNEKRREWDKTARD